MENITEKGTDVLKEYVFALHSELQKLGNTTSNAQFREDTYDLLINLLSKDESYIMIKHNILLNETQIKNYNDARNLVLNMLFDTVYETGLQNKNDAHLFADHIYAMAHKVKHSGQLLKILHNKREIDSFFDKTLGFATNLYFKANKEENFKVMLNNANNDNLIDRLGIDNLIAHYEYLEEKKSNLFTK